MNLRIIFLVFIFFIPALSVTANTIDRNINLTVNPEKVLFDLTNLKPGDTIERKLTIINNGNSDFNYITTSKFLEGSQRFNEKIDLRISDINRVLYEGKLSNFNKLKGRVLDKNTNESLIFSIKIPYELGNEYQGEISKVQFKFYVEGTLGGVLPADGPKLPNTGSDMFNILVVGAVLVLTGSTLQFFIKRRNKLDKQV
jgi:LPXTG-motif cell wall-anchored protein